MKFPSCKRMIRLSIPIVLLFSSPAGLANLYSYPNGKKPALPLEAAVEVCKTFMKKEVFKDFYITEVVAYGSEKQDSSGAWTFVFHKEGGTRTIMLSIRFPEDECIVQLDGFPDPTPGQDGIRSYTRDGKPMPEGAPPAPAAGPDPFAPAKTEE